MSKSMFGIGYSCADMWGEEEHKTVFHVTYCTLSRIVSINQAKKN